MSLGTHNAIPALYRNYLRQVRNLPLLYLRQYLGLKASDDFRSILQSKKDDVRGQKLKRVRKDLRKLEAANAGNPKAFAHILDLAYGRKGKLRWELMEPLKSDPNAPTPPPIIPSVEKSRPPVYSPELKALLISPHSRTTKPLEPKSLKTPPTLPERADPASEDARLLGPFSKRREVNIRWRYFTKEWKKVRPPLQVVISDNTFNHKTSSPTDVMRAGIRGFGLQGSGVFEEIEAIVGPPRNPRPLTRKERRNADMTMAVSTGEIPRRHPSRWLRRRYQELLGRLPLLVFTPPPPGTPHSGKYAVVLASNAISPSLRHSADRLVEVPAVGEGEWLTLAESVKPPP